MRVLLNTIALEPNRWTKDHRPAHDLGAAILPRATAAGFRRFEVWQYHVEFKSLDEVRSLRLAAEKLGAAFDVLGVYPVLHLEEAEYEAERRRLMALLDKAVALGVRWVKFFFGKMRGADLTARQLELTTAHVGEWIAQGRKLGLGFCAELHSWTLLDPYDFGRRYLAAHPELDMRICFQPWDSGHPKPDPAVTLAATLQTISELAPLIVHAHFTGSNESGRCRLREASRDWRAVIRALARANPDLLPSVEFVPRGFPAQGQPFDWDGALADAVEDARFIEEALRTANSE